MEFTGFHSDFRRYLSDEFEARSLRNPNYSLRAFARDLGLAVSTLTEIKKGKYGLSRARALAVGKKLRLSEEQCAHFLDLITIENSRSALDRELAEERVTSRLKRSVQSISVDSFKVISEWYHLAILELTELENFQPHVEWIARRLEISPIVVDQAIQRLERLGLLEVTSSSIKATGDFTAVGNGLPSEAIRKFHRQIIEKALAAIDLQNLENREVSSTVFSIQKNDLSEAKRELLKFRRSFAKKFTSTASKDKVYCLAMQFFDLAQGDTK